MPNRAQAPAHPSSTRAGQRPSARPTQGPAHQRAPSALRPRTSTRPAPCARPARSNLTRPRNGQCTARPPPRPSPTLGARAIVGCAHARHGHGRQPGAPAHACALGRTRTESTASARLGQGCIRPSTPKPDKPKDSARVKPSQRHSKTPEPAHIGSGPDRMRAPENQTRQATVSPTKRATRGQVATTRAQGQTRKATVSPAKSATKGQVAVINAREQTRKIISRLRPAKANRQRHMATSQAPAPGQTRKAHAQNQRSLRTLPWQFGRRKHRRPGCNRPQAGHAQGSHASDPREQGRQQQIPTNRGGHLDKSGSAAQPPSAATKSGRAWANGSTSRRHAHRPNQQQIPSAHLNVAHGRREPKIDSPLRPNKEAI
ncbi:translation initiation factor IF-2-like [Phoenix dactylifera]|uniref:Translation initiation factor IF-2-like n=1 Tax=Phoenix dactylifera TaxID=42345 RepID=A0A8B9AR99_PHODC|nr:translation initiation factor IF-2-like [Phoenix dactylifera]